MSTFFRRDNGLGLQTGNARPRLALCWLLGGICVACSLAPARVLPQDQALQARPIQPPRPRPENVPSREKKRQQQGKAHRWRQVVIASFPSVLGGGEFGKGWDDFVTPLRRELAKNKISTMEKAIGAAIAYLKKAEGDFPPGIGRVEGLLPLGIDVPGFAKKGSLVWIVRFRGLGATPGPEKAGLTVVTQELWVSSTTGKVRAVLPMKPKRK